MTEGSTTGQARTRRRVLATLGTTALVGATGCSGNPLTNTPTGGASPTDGGTGTDDPTPTAAGTATPGDTGGTLTMAQAAAPSTFDPVVLDDVASREIANLIFEGLYAYDRNTGLRPALATGMPQVSKGATRFRVSVASEATFSNGDPVTAEDVRYSYTAPVNQGTPNAASFGMIDSVTVEDRRTVRFDLQFPYAPFGHVLTAGIVPKVIRERDRAAFGTNPVGSGPFTLDAFRSGELTRLAADEGYWGEPAPNLDTVEFRPVQDATTRLTGLQNGTHQVVKRVPERFFDTVQGMDGAELRTRPTLYYAYLAMNCREGPTSDPTVREAVDYVFSMDDAVSQFVEPRGVRQYSPIPAPMAETWDLPTNVWKGIPHEKDIERARQLFDAAGVQTDYQWRIIVPPVDRREQVGISVGNGLQEAGFQNVTVQRLDWGAFIDRHVTGRESDYNLYVDGWTGIADPASFTYPLFARADEVLGKTNGTFYGANSANGREVSRKLISARETGSFEKRRRLYVETITTILEDRVHIPAYDLRETYAVRGGVSDFLPHPVDEFHLATDHNNVSIAGD